MMKNVHKWMAPLCVAAVSVVVPPQVLLAAPENAPIVIPQTTINEPVVLQQKWVAGQQLEYDLLLDGTLNMLMPLDGNTSKEMAMFAGLPLQVDLKMKGQTSWETLAVDEFGTGTVAVRMPQLAVLGRLFGQKMELDVQNGRGIFKWNGKVANNKISWPFLSEPKNAILISPRGRLEGFSKLGDEKTAATEAPAATRANETQSETGQRPAINYAAMLQDSLLKILPVLWPQRPVKTGETWTAEIQKPALPVAGAEKQEPSDRIKLTLRGEEEVAGRKTQRIALEGTFDFDKEKAKEEVEKLSPTEREAFRKNMNWLQNANQNISGDVWFDAAAGQVVRIELSLSSQTQGMPSAANKATATDEPKERGARPGGWSDFNGVFQMQLRDVKNHGDQRNADAG